jgi:hypothetical protein
MLPLLHIHSCTAFVMRSAAGSGQVPHTHTVSHTRVQLPDAPFYAFRFCMSSMHATCLARLFVADHVSLSVGEIHNWWMFTRIYLYRFMAVCVSTVTSILCKTNSVLGVLNAVEHWTEMSTACVKYIQSPGGWSDVMN